jgi:outer membrane protein assembly factor BamB
VAYTGGAIRYPPTIWKGRAFVGAGDGWVYCYEARTGRLQWRFRAAPAERLIPVYGQLMSTWPAASGVLVQDGVAYVAAGIVNYDGTHVYALDAATGGVKWQNSASGHLDPEARTGVSVQGHLMICDGKLFLAGGNVVSPGIYDLKDGRCLSDAGLVHRTVNNNVPASLSSRGCELYRVANTVLVSGKPFYAHPKYPVFDATVLNKTLVASAQDLDLLWVNNNKVLCYTRLDDKRDARLESAWGKPEVPGQKPVWERDCKDSLALAVGRNAVVIASSDQLVALSLKDGRALWQQPLPAVPVPWGLALDSAGRVIITLEDGQVLCFAQGATLAAR